MTPIKAAADPIGELKPCPFCGLNYQRISSDPCCFAGQVYPGESGNEGFIIRCDSCGCQTCWWHSKDQVCEAWNRRLSAPAGNAGVRQKPFAWVMPGSDTANDRGFIDAMAWEEGEFTKPLYALPQPREAFADEIKRADAAPPEASFDNASDMLRYLNAPREAEPVAWRSIDSAPTDRFILLYCHEDNSRWLAKWQGGVWYGVDVDHGLTREGHSWGDPDYVTGWFVSKWTDVPALKPDTAASPSPIPEAPTIDSTPSCGQENDYRRAQGSIPEAPVVREWQPIETAHNHGEILLWWKHAGVGIGYWDDEGDGWRCEGDECVPKNQSDCTHWMPKPDGPRALKPQDGGSVVANEDISTNPAPRLHAFKPRDGGETKR